MFEIYDSYYLPTELSSSDVNTLKEDVCNIAVANLATFFYKFFIILSTARYKFPPISLRDKLLRTAKTAVTNRV